MMSGFSGFLRYYEVMNSSDLHVHGGSINNDQHETLRLASGAHCLGETLESGVCQHVGKMPVYGPTTPEHFQLNIASRIF